MEYATLLERVRHWTGLPNTSAAQRALDATVTALGTCLPAPDRGRWANSLPAELRETWQLATYCPHQTTAAVLARVPAIEHVPQPYAAEHAQAVIRVLADALAPEDRALLARHLPDELAALVRDPSLDEGVATWNAREAPPAPERDTSLASGRPGSLTPLSEAHPKSSRS